MNPNKVILVYFLLSLLIIGSAVLLGKQVHHYLYEPEDPLEPFKDKEISSPEVLAQLTNAENQERQATLMVFSQTNAFRALVTPLPRPSPTPQPLPSPTPVIAARNYILNFVSGDFVSLTDYKGNLVNAKVGDVVKEDFWGDFKIVKVSSAPDMTVTVQDVKSGATRIIKFGETGQQPVPGQPVPPQQPK